VELPNDARCRWCCSNCKPRVNPSLTITAQAERAISFWPNKGELDPRPVQNSEYKRINAVAPHSPFVPAGAIGELLMPPTK